MSALDSPLGRACTLLFVPGTQPQRFAKALASGAGAVIIDWEDAVAPDRKAEAREQTLQALAVLTAQERQRVAVRVNAAATPWHADDLAALQRAAAVQALVLPQAERAATVAEAAAALGQGAAVLPLVESVVGLYAVRELAGAPGCLRLLFGHLDFQADAGLAPGPDEQELAPVRLQLVLASRAAGLPAPVDGVTPSVDDRSQIHRDASRALRGGFGGKLCIHPAQVGPVHDAFRPSVQELDWARRVIAGFSASSGSAFALDGRMVDAPVVKLAERILHRQQALAPEKS